MGIRNFYPEKKTRKIIFRLKSPSPHSGILTLMLMYQILALEMGRLMQFFYTEMLTCLPVWTDTT